MARKPDAAGERQAALRLVARQAEALRRKVGGDSFDQIAAGMRGRFGAPPNYHARLAASDVQAALTLAQSLLSPKDDKNAKELLRVLELQKLDALEHDAASIQAAAMAEGERLDAMRAIDRRLRISARRDALMGLAAEAEMPPNPEADQVDELQLRREDKLLRGAGQRS